MRGHKRASSIATDVGADDNSQIHMSSGHHLKITSFTHVPQDHPSYVPIRYPRLPWETLVHQPPSPATK